MEVDFRQKNAIKAEFREGLEATKDKEVKAKEGVKMKRKRMKDEKAKAKELRMKVEEVNAKAIKGIKS